MVSVKIFLMANTDAVFLRVCVEQSQVRTTEDESSRIGISRNRDPCRLKRSSAMCLRNGSEGGEP